jgi:copper(I)-binding protein
MKPLFLAMALSLGAILPAAAQTPAAPTVKVDSAWARATPGGARTAAIYLRITAKGAGDRLVGCSTPVAEKAQVHSETMANGVMEMRPVAALAVTPGTPTVLKPGGYHIMLIGLKQPLKAGDSFPLTLDFASAGKQQVSVRVEKPGAMGMEGMPGMKGMEGMPGMGH